MPFPRPRASASARSRLFADTPPAIPTLARLIPARGVEQSVEQRGDDDALKARADVRGLASRQRIGGCQAERRAAGRDVAQHRRLQPAEAEVAPSRQMRRVAIDMGQAHFRKRHGAIVAAARASRSTTGPPGYPRPSSLATLSYASPAASSRVRPSSSYDPAPRRDRGWCGRPTRPGRRPAAASRRLRARAIRCGRQGDGPARRAPTAPRRATSRTTGPRAAIRPAPGPCVTATASMAGDPAVGERALDDAADVAHVLPRRQLRDDAAPFAMDLDLRGDDVRADPPRASRVTGLLDERRGRFVAGGLDAQDDHASQGRGDRMLPAACRPTAELHERRVSQRFLERAARCRAR